MVYVGVARREGFSPLPGPGSGSLGKKTVAVLDLPVSAELARASRPVNAWSLDEDALAESVKRYASQVDLVDARA